MNVSKYICVIAAIALGACNSAKHENTSKDSIKAVADGPGKILDEKYLVVAGKSIGQISVGDSLQKVNRILGNADAGDAAMGKAWAIWYTKDPTTTQTSEYCIFSSYKDSTMSSKDVKQIRATSILFKTQDGFGVDRTFDDTKAKFGGLKKVSKYLNEKQDTITIYDDASLGIGFEFVRGRSTAISVHQPNKPIQSDYLSPNPKWKKIELKPVIIQN
ncbi:hypothetical protein ABIB40_002003 [Pedobacter sp. UYP30]|uniref:hypothetical protein n=1 Tax=Pedobacter sp. UYP30 TaxID=1756400 RepID=UPI0033915EA2